MQKVKITNKCVFSLTRRNNFYYAKKKNVKKKQKMCAFIQDMKLKAVYKVLLNNKNY